jgi:hypothetical protein
MRCRCRRSSTSERRWEEAGGCAQGRRHERWFPRNVDALRDRALKVLHGLRGTQQREGRAGEHDEDGHDRLLHQTRVETGPTPTSQHEMTFAGWRPGQDRDGSSVHTRPCGTARRCAPSVPVTVVFPTQCATIASAGPAPERMTRWPAQALDPVQTRPVFDVDHGVRFFFSCQSAQ